MTSQMYRYDINPHRRWVGTDYAELVGVEVKLRVFPVRQTTPMGVWVYDQRTHRERWVSLHTRKAWAYDTPEKALESYRHRAGRRRMHLKRDLEEILLALLAVENDDLYQAVPGIFDETVAEA